MMLGGCELTLGKCFRQNFAIPDPTPDVQLSDQEEEGESDGDDLENKRFV